MLDPGRDEDPRLRRLADEQAALRRVATLVACESSPDRLLAVVAAQVARVFDVPLVRLVRYEPDGSVLLVGGFGEGRGALFPVGSRWPIDNPGVREAVRRTGRSARVDDYTNIDGQAAAAVRRSGMRSSVGSPIVVEGRLWGTMMIASPRREPLPEDTEARLANFTELVATAIANAESRAAVSLLAEEQAALRQVATLVARGVIQDQLFSAVSNEVGRLFGSGQAAIGRYEPDGSSVVYVGISQGLSTIPIGTRWPLEDFLASTTVYRTGRPARQEQRDYDTASGQVAETLRELNTVSRVGAPIFVEANLWGVLLVTDTRELLPPDTEERVAKFTELIGTAMANAESRAELAASEARARDLAREQAALRRVATLVAEGTSADELFSAVTEEIGRLFGAQVGISRFEPDGSAMVVVGVTAGIPTISIGTRFELDDILASTAVYRTGRPARNDHTAHRTASGQVADSLRQMNFTSTVAVPIVVEGKVWGALAVSDQREQLPLDTEGRAAKFTELVATAIANAESRAELGASEARAHDLATEQAALRRVATRVAEGASADELFATVAQEVADVVGIPVIGVDRFEGDGTFTMVGIAGETGFTVGSRWQVEDEGLAGMILATGRPARKDDYTSMAGPLGAAMRGDRMIATVGVPIVVEGSMWGFIVGAAHPGESIPDGTEERLARFTDLVATAIANGQARERLAQLLDEQAALRRIATMVAQESPPDEVFAEVAEAVAVLLGLESAAVFSYGQAADATVVGSRGDPTGAFPVGRRFDLDGDNLTARVYHTRLAARIDDYDGVSGSIGASVRQAELRAGVGSPILVNGRLWGALAAVTARPGPLPVDVESRLAQFSDLVATAISNVEARTEVQRLAEEQTALRRVATLVAQGVSPDEVFSVVGNEVGRLFGSDQVAVGRYEPDGSGVVFVGVSHGMRGVTIGTRWALEDFLALTTVYRTGRPATRNQSDYEDVSGPIADSLREMNFVSRIAAPIIVEGNLWGVMTVNDAHERLAPDAEERVAKFTELVATAIANADSRAELTASRARVIAAADEARRRIERDLHDGAQQRLVTLSVALRTMQTTMPAGSERGEVARIADGLAVAVEELRELSRGIHPAVLTQGGLAPALKALRRRSPVRVTLDIRFERRLPDQVEAAAYYTVSEALTNASRHASATRVWVDVEMTDGTLHLSIRDDGIGGADPRRGSGLTGLKDRIEALGGAIRIDSAPGSGTHIEVELPISQPLQSRSESNEPIDGRTAIQASP